MLKKKDRFLLFLLTIVSLFTFNNETTFANPLEKHLNRFLPNSDSDIKRVFCSLSNDMGNTFSVDFHFHSHTGKIYSYDDFKETLIPFRLTDLDGFNESDMDDVSSFNSIVRKNSLKVRILVPTNDDGFESLDLKMDLNTLKVNMSIRASDQFLKEKQIAYFTNRVKEGTKCNYMNTLSTEIE